MKKAFTLILAILYITASSGVVLNTHLCMGKKAVKNCICSKEESKNGCCKDVVKVVKLDNDHNIASIAYNIEVPVATLLPVTFEYYKTILPSLQIGQPVAHGPPIISSPDIYLLNRVFRI